MDINYLKDFLKKFDLDDNKINLFLKNKKLFNDNNKNIYLSKNKEFLIQDLVFVNLKKQLVSKYLLRFIKDNSHNIIEILNEKQALNFTYSKDLMIDRIKDSKIKKFSKNKFYLILFEDKILGYSEFVKVAKKFVFRNEMNIGEYLKEN